MIPIGGTPKSERGDLRSFDSWGNRGEGRGRQKENGLSQSGKINEGKGR